MAVGHAKKDKIFYSKAKGLNKSVVMLVLKQEETVYMEHQWLQQNLMKILKIKNLQFK